ncbi:MAG: precorrin-3B C(17)-methyltransferase [Lachnospiraceae bacterium]|nr:precorrin-3B C(17)-methyltransferase [Lachnospiraceae bacterium]
MNKIYIVGMGPGSEDALTPQAKNALTISDCIVGYNVYLDLLPDELKKKELISTPMKQEVRRCEIVYEEALKGKTVSIICSGDAGVYGMASLMYELKERYPDTTLEVIPGITAALSGAAVLGAPVNHDFCIISLSDLLTPWEKIEKRLRAAADGDFAIVLYNPSSHKRKDYLKRACEILLETIENDRPCGYVKNIGRDGQESGVMTLSELRDFEVDMFTTVFIGNSESRIIDGALVTGRGYKIE